MPCCLLVAGLRGATAHWFLAARIFIFSCEKREQLNHPPLQMQIQPSLQTLFVVVTRASFETHIISKSRCEHRDQTIVQVYRIEQKGE